MTDTDGDSLPDYYENLIGTDITEVDTDGDGISDYQEYISISFDPLKYDTDENGISDADEDPDQDGLSNGNELLLGTKIFNPDTDGVGDAEEVVPQNISVIIDNQEKIGIEEVTVNVSCIGNAKKNINIHDIYGIDVFISDVVGMIGVPVYIQSEVEYEQAQITFKYDRNALVYRGSRRF